MHAEGPGTRYSPDNGRLFLAKVFNEAGIGDPFDWDAWQEGLEPKLAS